MLYQIKQSPRCCLVITSRKTLFSLNQTSNFFYALNHLPYDIVNLLVCKRDYLLVLLRLSSFIIHMSSINLSI